MHREIRRLYFCRRKEKSNLNWGGQNHIVPELYRLSTALRASRALKHSHTYRRRLEPPYKNKRKAQKREQLQKKAAPISKLFSFSFISYLMHKFTFINQCRLLKECG